MFRPLLVSLILLLSFQILHAQKKYINRKIAQKNYDGYMLMIDKKYEAALQLFNEALSEDPEAFFIYQNRALCKLQLKDTIGAIGDFKSNIQLEPDNAETRYALGNIYKHRNDSVNAIKYFMPAIAVADNEFSQTKLLYMNQFVGNYYRLTEKYDSALVFYERVKSYAPENASVYINSAVCNFHLDSIDNFCADLEKAFILGGDVNCIALKSYCDGCSHLLEARGHTDTLSMAVDKRLAGIISDTIYYPHLANNSYQISGTDYNRKVKVYFNANWQICLPGEASFYRKAFWAKFLNNFGGEFEDYYASGELYAKGRLEKNRINGEYLEYYKNGNLKLKAHFANALPEGTWIYFNENGFEDMIVTFKDKSFELKITDQNNPNYHLNSGSGKFEIFIEKWQNISFILRGEYIDNMRHGKWTYSQGDEIILQEKYKNGAFKNGFINTDQGRLSLVDSALKPAIFIPPHINQMGALYFSTAEAANYYSYIKTVGL